MHYTVEVLNLYANCKSSVSRFLNRNYAVVKYFRKKTAKSNTSIVFFVLVLLFDPFGMGIIVDMQKELGT